MDYGDHTVSLYLAREMGRPFSKALVIPFPEITGKPVLFIELLKPTEKGKLQLQSFFLERRDIIHRVLQRLLLHTGLSRASSLWGHVFGGWREPLAILRNFKVIRSNRAFEQLSLDYPDLLTFKKTTNFLRLKDRVYKRHYYPVVSGYDKKLIESGVLYYQDLTDYFQLREKLLQSEKMTSLARLGQNIAHELNNPLTGISSLIQALRENSKELSFLEEFQEMEKASRRCQKIIGNLLSFSLSTETAQDTLDLNQVLEETLPLLKTLLARVRLTLKTSPRPLPVRGNFSLLQQGVFNIILNGCQALEGRPSPKMEIQSGFSKEGKAFISIKDNGPGIPEAQLEKIFQPLWTTKREGEGTGLGLSMAQRVIKSFGGEVSVSNISEGGACFKILLPLLKEKDVSFTGSSLKVV